MSREEHSMTDMAWFKFHGQNYFPYINAASAESAGLVLKAVCSYMSGTPAQDLSLPDPLSQAIFNAIRQDVDKSYESYIRQVEGGKKGGRPPKKTHPYPPEPSQTEQEEEQEKEKEEEKEGEEEEEPEREKEKKGFRARGSDGGYGRYGWVKLTRMEYVRLCGELGEDEVNRCICYLDERAQFTGNKNGWKDWEVLVRRCSRDRWGEQRRGTEGYLPGTSADCGKEAFLCGRKGFAAAGSEAAERIDFRCP